MQKQTSIIIGVIIAVAIIAGGGVFAYQYFLNSKIPMTNVQSNPNVQNSNTEIADWKTYTSDEYGFEFKYPSDFFEIGYPFNVTTVPSATGYDMSKGECMPVLPLPGFGDIGGGKVTINGNNYCHYQLSYATPDYQYYKDYYLTINKYIQSRFPYFLLSIELDSFSSKCGNYLPLESTDNKQKDSYSRCRAERSNIVQQIASTFKFTSQPDSFIFKNLDTYSNTKKQLTINGWTPIVQINQEIIDSQFPEIGNCGSGVNTFCNVDFQKGIYKNHLNVQSRNINGTLQWIVVGSE